MTLEDSVECPGCDKDTFVCVNVPESAWSPNGAYFTWKEECQHCGELVGLRGTVTSEIDLA